MKRVISFSAIATLIIVVISFSCTTQDQETEEPAMIENTLQSVSYFADTVGLNPQVLLEAFNKVNTAIDSIGYPDAGYKLWLIQEDSADIRFMVEGFWPNQDIYSEIHAHPLYKEFTESWDNDFAGLDWIEYHQFIKVK